MNVEDPDKTFAEKHLVPNFQRSWAWLSAIGALLLSYGPDIVSLVLLRWDLVQTALPELAPEWKARVMIAGAVLTVLTRPLKQRNMPPTMIPVVSVTVPDTVEVGHGGPSVATDIEHTQRVKADPGPPS